MGKKMVALHLKQIRPKSYFSYEVASLQIVTMVVRIGSPSGVP